MRTNLDFSPFFRSSVGFDRVFSLLHDASRLASDDSAPSFDISRIGEDGYRIDLAVPGFDMSSLSVTQEGNVLTITGQLPSSEREGEFLHQGIYRRDFVRTFELADHVDVTGAEYIDGILSIALTRQLPDELKPRVVPITVSNDHEPQRLESRKAA